VRNRGENIYKDMRGGIKKGGKERKRKKRMRREEKDRKSRSSERGCDYALSHALSSCIFVAHALQPLPETSESDSAPYCHYGGASVRKSRRTLLACCRRSARLARISLTFRLCLASFVLS